MEKALVPLPSQPAGAPWPTREWPEGALDSAVDRPALEKLLAHALSQPEEMGQTNAVVVVHRGRIVAERYADEIDAATTHISWSMAKSILHAAVGLLVGDGRLDPAAPSRLPFWRPDDPRSAITLGQLLEMRSGLRFLEDYVDAQVSNVIEMLFGAGQRDVARYAADKPLDHAPGSFFSYSSGTSNLVSAMLSQELGAGDPVEAFLRERLFAPIGIRSASLRFDEAGTWIGSSFVFATARDFARFGLLYLRDGVWAGRRVLPAGWVDRGRRLSDPAPNEAFSYGAHWWVVPGSLGSFQAQGYNGQRIAIVPGLDLIVVRLGVTPAAIAPNLNRWMKEVVDAFRPAGSGMVGD
jgi:CubicO group peptidase (beta-lactamase class C family)